MLYERNSESTQRDTSDFETFIESKTIIAEVKAEGNYQHSLTKNGSFDQTHLELIMDTNLSNIESTKESFGTVTSETEPPLVVLKKGKSKQAQTISVVSRVANKSFDDLKLSQILQFRVPERRWSRQSYSIRGISALPGGKIMLADSNGRKLFIFNYPYYGMLDKSIRCQIVGTRPNDVTYIKDNEVAISTSSGIQIINIESSIVIENIITDGECQGIAYNNGALICSVKTKGIQHIQITNKTITTLVKYHDNIDRLGISVYGNKIYETTFKNSIVNCYTMEGNLLWQFKNTSVLQYPTGITVDKNSNVYVATYYSDYVIVLSSDGKKFKQILTKIDGLRTPTAIHFDHNRLIVANVFLPIYIYNVF